MFKKQLIIIILKKLLQSSVVIALAVVIIIFLSKQISKISFSMEQQRTLSAVLEKRNETLSGLNDDFKEVNGMDEKISGAFPPADNILDFISALERIAAAGSINQTLNFSSPTGSVIEYDINLSGNILSFIEYLKKFEKLPYFTSISGIRLQAINGDWAGNSSVTFKSKVNVR